VRLVGPDALPDEQRLVLETAHLLTTGFLQQNALDPVDTYAFPEKQIAMLKLILRFHERAEAIVKRGAVITDVQKLPVIHDLLRMKADVPNDNLALLDKIGQDLEEQMDKLEARYK
jgi:V/A-type H+-transporting ATPase subunit A